MTFVLPMWRERREGQVESSCNGLSPSPSCSSGGERGGGGREGEREMKGKGKKREKISYSTRVHAKKHDKLQQNVKFFA